MFDDLVQAIQTGDQAKLNCLLSADPALAQARVDGHRTPLHIATDWPGHFPNVSQTISILIAKGAEVNAKAIGLLHTETPLHWAASSDDVEALDALLDHGADIEATGAVIGGGTPLADAVAFATWNAARRLIARGALPTFWQAAALGLLDQLKVFREPTPDEITNAFWNACHGGQLPSAQYLLAKGANLNWIGHDHLTPLGAAKRNGNPELLNWLQSQTPTTDPSQP